MASCRHCSRTFDDSRVGSGPRPKYCGKECKRLANLILMSQRWKRVAVHVDRSIKHCANSCCKKVFAADRAAGKAAKYCSEECKRKEKYRLSSGNTHKRRAKKYGCTYSPFDVLKVFERDDWKCQSCLIDTPEMLKGKRKPNSPTLDHIVPLSMQGPHTMANCQCLCYHCNLKKGATFV